MVSQCNIYVVQYSMLEMNRKEKNKVSKVRKMGSPSCKVAGQSSAGSRRVNVSPNVQ